VVVTDGKVDLDLEMLLVRSETLLLMPMKEGLKTTADEACDDGKHADGEEVDKNVIVIEADREVDRC
jgi:hypothetical protein